MKSHGYEPKEFVSATGTAQKSEFHVLSKHEEQRYTLGVVYEPLVLDTQEEFAKAEDIEEAAWGFMARLQTLAKAAGTLLKSAILRIADRGTEVPRHPVLGSRDT
ncbi:MAG: XkdF-like putative serine protease domain-containing protein [Vicinamibacterales bacterium]|nr:hypothetical protein [Acidobacteriota bacterium]MDP7293834.1 XkdF-like putative serine protease domain-containing protein [Vicinamibacterales bacterium]MDP7472446.1 XkdF-like putative serine protease domain-containing protein [Vicinamibacterales bacterium]MDP7672773.1 XkdF-like putative serine protease domain-containing protein [Vicinamibacterales bacterium]HJO37579.1 XkdF-like putative serine protease domain-containing protein [Vicinamibacterales bacterium]